MSMSSAENVPPQHTPRPPNSFMCFRSWYARQLKEKIAQAQAEGSKISKAQMVDLSRLAAAKWNSMSVEERKPFVEMAHRAKDAHKTTYPDYKFAPKKGTGSKSGGRPRPSGRGAPSSPNDAAVEPELVLSSNSFAGRGNAYPSSSSPYYSPNTQYGGVPHGSYESAPLARAPSDFQIASGSYQHHPSHPNPFTAPHPSHFIPAPSNPAPPSPFQSYLMPPDAYGRAHDLTAAPSHELPPADFSSFCQWDDDFSHASSSSYAGAPQKSHYRPY
ncbi:hypothetical protein R3P38DRAFT_3201807 [Favolaschia claudopus]|uniref:HMG box domain-containing protein n=1 Tax=Favolaschia claudopus TaxID=2862362 RepID=A0AAW0AVY2_9AGAR